MTRLLATIGTAVMLGAAALAGAGVAAAHATRIATDPADGAVLNDSPQRASATFNEALQKNFAAMTVVGPDGNMWSTGPAEIQGAVASVALRPLGPAGTYTVNYRVTSADGHPVSGSWTFKLSVAGTGTPGPPVGKPDGSGDNVPVWPFAVLAVAIVGAGIWWISRRRE